jgi:hypothetical protein
MEGGGGVLGAWVVSLGLQSQGGFLITLRGMVCCCSCKCCGAKASRRGKRHVVSHDVWVIQG